MVYIGIDPGKSGGMAFVFKGESVIANSIPFGEEAYLKAFKDIKTWGAPVVCCIERVNAMPKQGVTSMFNFGQNYGWLLGVLDALEIPYETVTPKKWKAEFGLTGDKMDSITVCKRLFPNVSLLPTERCKKDNDGMAEALLLAEYARRKM